MKYIIFTLAAALLLTILSFVPMWQEPTKGGSIRINTWEKRQIDRGQLFID